MVQPTDDPRKKLDEAVIAPPPTRRYRAAAFQAYVLIAAAGFVTMAVLAHFVAYFPLDLVITRAVQSYHGDLFAKLMFAVSWIGFFPQVVAFGALAIIFLFITGLRWESVALIFAACGISIGTLVKLIVTRPRPSADLVHVFAQIPASGFPSGHVLAITTFGGFLAFLCFTLLKPSAGRTALFVLTTTLIILMGLSRIYQGQHWFSDVMGAYLLGSLWLALTIKVYRWGKPKFFVRQPVAPEVPAPKPV